MFIQILLSYFLQVGLIFGTIFLFGFLIALCNRAFYANFGSHARAVCYVTGFIGVPIHELSHALMCVLFGHHIVKIKLFQIGAEDGTLGYVTHTYSKRNIYQRIGNFFIGIAPIVVITAILFLLAWLLLPGMVADLSAATGSAAQSGKVMDMLLNIPHTVKTFFSFIGTWQWWVFVGIGMLLALHMTLSGADIKNALSGMIFVFLTMFIVDIALGYADIALLNRATSYLLTGAGYMICFFSMALVIDLIALVFSLIVHFIRIY